MDTVLHFRLTSERTAKEVMEGITSALQGPCKGVETLLAVLTGYEIGLKKHEKHTHSAIYTNLSKNTTRERLKLYFKVRGQRQYILEEVKDLEHNLSYVTKNGDISWSQNFEKDVKIISEITPWVYAQKSFDDRVKELDQLYLEQDTTDDSYLESLLSLYAAQGPRNLMLHHVRSHWLALFNRRNRISVRRKYNMNGGYDEEQYYPRQVLVSQIKNFIDNKY